MQVAHVSERDLMALPRTGLDNVPRLELDATTFDGALAATAGAGPDPLEAVALAWVLTAIRGRRARYWRDQRRPVGFDGEGGPAATFRS